MEIHTFILAEFILIWITVSVSSLQNNITDDGNTSRLQCTSKPLDQLRIVDETQVSFMYSDELPGTLYSGSNYDCITDFLSSDTNFLHVVPIETVRLLVKCNRSSTTISFLPLGSLGHLKSLSDLSFFNCKFGENISIGDWLGGILIERLFVENTERDPVNTTPAFTDTFYDNPKLSAAVLTRNGIETLPTSLLCKWTSLQRLWLTHNRISDLTFFYKRCENTKKQPLQSLEELYLSYNQLTSITEKLLTSFPNLHYLYLSFNKIHTIMADLSPMNTMNLRTLEIEGNNLTNFGLCKVLPHLVDLDVSYNHFECTSDYLELKYCTSLMTLSLADVTASHCESMWTTLPLLPQLYGLWIEENYEETFDFGRIPKELRFLQITQSRIRFVTDMQNATFELNVIVIDMGMNNLTHLANFSFPPTLVSLNLPRNQITSIEPHVFSPCLELSSIDLSHNKLTDISGLFVHLLKLSNLYLTNNNILRFDYSMIPKNLYSLSLSQNAIEEITDNEEVIHDLNLRYLNLSKNHFITLNQNSFAPSIFNLDLSHCQVDSCHEDAFKNLNKKYYVIVRNFTAHNIQNPFLTQTELASTLNYVEEDSICINFTYVCSCACAHQNASMCCNTFNSSGFTRSYLYFEFTLDFNNLLFCLIESSCFDLCNSAEFYNSSYQYQPLNTLFCNETMNLMHYYKGQDPMERQANFFTQGGLLLNKMNISALKEGAFEHFQQLLILNLDDNYLTEIRSLEFANLINLTKLYLNRNSLSHISPYSFKDLQNLKFLELKQNWLHYLTKDTFAGLEDLRRLYLSQNSIRALNYYTFEYLNSLKQLHLSMNQIQQIDRLDFAGLVALRKLYLDGNNIITIEDCGFSEMPRLTELYLQNNAITSVSNSTFHGLAHLRILHLYGNQIEVISEYGFVSLPSLNNLLLHNNLLTKWSLALPEHLTNLTMAQNQFPCDCKSIFHLREELSQMPPGILTDSEKNRCIFPDSDLTQHTIKNITEDECYNGTVQVVQWNVVLTASIVPTIISFVVLCGTSALYIYRLEVQVLVYSKFHVRFWSNNPENDTGKQCDAFISYNTNDRNFIAEQLLPLLEKQFRVCIHERDFLVGAYITDSIIDVVENSCRTLVILSPNFIQSEWCLFEFKFAHYQALKDKCCRLIIILLEDVNMDELSSEIKAYMRTNTYLRWGDPLFWPKLMYSMPDHGLADTSHQILSSRYSTFSKALAPNK